MFSMTITADYHYSGQSVLYYHCRLSLQRPECSLLSLQTIQSVHDLSTVYNMTLQSILHATTTETTSQSVHDNLLSIHDTVGLVRVFSIATHYRDHECS